MSRNTAEDGTRSRGTYVGTDETLEFLALKNADFAECNWRHSSKVAVGGCLVKQEPMVTNAYRIPLEADFRLSINRRETALIPGYLAETLSLIHSLRSLSRSSALVEPRRFSDSISRECSAAPIKQGRTSSPKSKLHSEASAPRIPSQRNSCAAVECCGHDSVGASSVGCSHNYDHDRDALKLVMVIEYFVNIIVVGAVTTLNTGIEPLLRRLRDQTI